MADLLNVYWTARAIRDLESIIHYLETNWSEKEVENFYTKLNKAISLISSRPKLFRLTNSRKNLRRCVLSKQTTIYYQEVEDKIYIIRVFSLFLNVSSNPRNSIFASQFKVWQNLSTKRNYT